MKERFALIQSNEDGTFDFSPGIDGKDADISDPKNKEYKAFYDTKNQKFDLAFGELTARMMHFFNQP